MQFVPHAYQEIAINHILDKPKCGLILDMGLGKTVSTLTALDELIFERFEVKKGSVLIIAPLRVAEHTWSTEIKKWDHLKHLKISKVIGSEKQRKEALKVKADIYIINRDNVVWLCKYLEKRWSFNTVIIDELSSFKNQKSKRFKALRKMTPFIKRLIGLTGTPAPRSLLDLWPQIYLMDGGERLGKTFTHYQSRYFIPGRRNGYVVYDYVLKQGAEKAIYESIQDICLSMKAKDWLRLPERVDIDYQIELKPTVQKRYKQFEKEKILEFENSEDKLLANNAGVLCGKLTQFTSGAVYTVENVWERIHDEKLDALEYLIESANGQPVLIFYNFKHDYERIADKFKILNPRKIEGPQDIEAWNKGDIQLLLAHPASMGHGLNLQQGGHIIIWFSLTWDLELYQQANARLHRQGQAKPVLVYHIVAKGTVDESIIDRLKNKDKSQQDLINAIKARMEGE